MTNRNSVNSGQTDVAIIGAGPAGLSAAIELKRLGIARVVVLEREPEAGGIPRHCGHPPFGMREFKRLLTGPQYARKLVATARTAGVELRLSTTVIEAQPGGQLLLTSDHGVKKLSARRVIYATGVRETPRSARLISGTRPLGVMNTGALQSMVYLKNRKPFQRPVIIGTELVSFSAIMTCRHAKIKPVAMIGENPDTAARWPSSLFPGFVGIPLHLKTRLVEIKGNRRVSAIEVVDERGHHREIECDGVILTGRFTPEAALARCGHLEVDIATGGPVVDQFGRCSDPDYFATGNVLRPVETAGWSWNEGRETAHRVAQDLAGQLPHPEHTVQIITTGPLIKYSMPQKITLPSGPAAMKNLQLRMSRTAKGRLIALRGGTVIWDKKMKVHRERRILIPVRHFVDATCHEHIELKFEET